MSRSALALLLLPAAVSAAAMPPAAPPYRISSMRAQLFYADRGTFSPNILGDSSIALWNTPIGEGTSGGPSSSTLVVVEVSGEAGSYEAARSVQLTATAGGRTLTQRTSGLSVLSESGRGFVGFWLYNTGCQEVRLSARIVGQPQPSTRTAVIPFECGE